MRSKPFIVHEFFCARKRGTPLRVRSEQIRIALITACNWPLRSRVGIFRSAVTIMQRFDCNPQFGLRKSAAAVRGNLFLFEFRNLMRQPRHFSLRRIAMHDAFLRRANQSRFGIRHGCCRAAAVAGGNRFLDLADRRAHTRAPRFIDDCSARGLTGSLLCRFRIRHTCWTQEMVTRAGLIGFWRETVNAAAVTRLEMAKPFAILLAVTGLSHSLGPQGVVTCNCRCAFGGGITR